jgi:hypothetical protein
MTGLYRTGLMRRRKHDVYDVVLSPRLWETLLALLLAPLIIMAVNILGG